MRKILSIKLFFFLVLGLMVNHPIKAQQSSLVSVNNQQFFLNSKPLYFIGTNYWYGGLLAIEKDKQKGIGRLRKELDFLKKNGVTNVRVLAGAGGKGINKRGD